MAKWIVYPQKRNIVEIERYIKPVRNKDDKVIARHMNYKSGKFFVVTSDDNVPTFDLCEIPDGDGKVDSILLGAKQGNIVSVQSDCMMDADEVQITYSDNVTARDRNFMHQQFDDCENEYEDRGWQLDVIDTYIWGKVDVHDEADEFVCSFNTQPQAIAA